jgi:hypothetical protein
VSVGVGVPSGFQIQKFMEIRLFDKAVSMMAYISLKTKSYIEKLMGSGVQNTGYKKSIQVDKNVSEYPAVKTLPATVQLPVQPPVQV